MNVIIIEDEELTASDLAETIHKINSSCQIVKTLSSVKEAIDYFKSNTNCDLIFSDIELGDGLSFEIFEKVKLNTPVIFCTAYNEYALQAFEANGIDYILKPFDEKAIMRSFEKLSNLSGIKNDYTSEYRQLINLLSKKQEATASSILTYSGDKITPIKISEILIAYSENEKSYVLVSNSKPVRINQSLDELQLLLGEKFYRANRHSIISRDVIKDVTIYFARKLLIKLSISYNEPIIVSKAKAPHFLEWLKK